MLYCIATPLLNNFCYAVETVIVVGNNNGSIINPLYVEITAVHLPYSAYSSPHKFYTFGKVAKFQICKGIYANRV